MATRTPTKSEALNAWRESILRDLKVALPARVEKYDATKQLVDVKLMIQDQFPDEDDGFTSISIPVLVSVPVIFPGAGGFRVTFPIQPGDIVQVLVNDRSLDTWLSQGGEQAPADQRRHHLSDAVCIPGLHDNKHPWTGASTSNLTMGKDGGAQIAITPTQIQLGGSSDALALAGLVDARLNALLNLLKTWTVVPNDGGAALKAAAASLTLPSVASSTVKAV